MTSTTYLSRPIRSRRASLRLEVTHEEDLPHSFAEVPALFMKWGLHKEPQECVWVVAYDSMLTVRTVIEVARWSHVKALVHLPTLLAAVITTGCERFMVVHNHPNKSMSPSAGDKAMTKAVMEGANACGLYLEDHVIINPRGEHYSFAKHGLISPVDYAARSTAAAAR